MVPWSDTFSIPDCCYYFKRHCIIIFLFKASAVQTQLLEIEPEYKANLLNAVEVYKETMVTFVGDYDEK